MIDCRLSFLRGGTELCAYATRKTETALERMRGLLFAPPLAAESALLISPCNSVHSFFMRYAIDVVYLDRQHQVCRLVRKMRPWRASAHFRASCVVELAAGEISTKGIQLGDTCQCQEF